MKTHYTYTKKTNLNTVNFAKESTMMSAQISSMLEHLRLGPFIKAVRSPTSNNNSSPEEDTTAAAAKCPMVLHTADNPPTVIMNGNTGTTSSSGDETDHINVVVTGDEDVDTKPQCTTDRRVLLVNSEPTTFDPKKRFSIPANAVGGGGDAIGAELTGRLKATRELVPSQARTRKMSQDLRFRGSNSQLSDDGGFESMRIRRPVKLKSILSEYEMYDSLHAKALEVRVERILKKNKVLIICIRVIIAILQVHSRKNREHNYRHTSNAVHKNYLYILGT